MSTSLPGLPLLLCPASPAPTPLWSEHFSTAISPVKAKLLPEAHQALPGLPYPSEHLPSLSPPPFSPETSPVWSHLRAFGLAAPSALSLRVLLSPSLSSYKSSFKFHLLNKAYPEQSI